MISEEWQEMRGVALSNFMSYPLFVSILQHRIGDGLKNNFCAFVRKSRNYIEETLLTLAKGVFEQLPRLHSRVIGLISQSLDEKGAAAEKIVCRLAETEASVVMTRDALYHEIISRTAGTARAYQRTESGRGPPFKPNSAVKRKHLTCLARGRACYPRPCPCLLHQEVCSQQHDYNELPASLIDNEHFVF